MRVKLGYDVLHLGGPNHIAHDNGINAQKKNILNLALLGHMNHRRHQPGELIGHPIFVVGCRHSVLLLVLLLVLHRFNFLKPTIPKN